MKIKTNNIHIYFSLIIYFIALTQPAITSSKLEDKTLSGIATLVMGGLSILGGGIFEWIIWLANPLYFLSIFFYFKSNITSKILSIFSSIIALSFITWKQILVSESGKLGNIDSLGLGYWLWAFSILSLTIGILLTKKVEK